MVIDVWSWDIAPGRIGEAMELCAKIEKCHRGRGINGRTLRPMNGQTQKVYAEMEFESLDALEKYWADFFANEWAHFADDWAKGALLEATTTRHQYTCAD